MVDRCLVLDETGEVMTDEAGDPFIDEDCSDQATGGWDPYYYKRRNRRRTKTEDVRAFLTEVKPSEIVAAPPQVMAQAIEARQAAEEFLADETAALKAKALQQINEFFSVVRLEAKRRADADDEDTDLLLLS